MQKNINIIVYGSEVSPPCRTVYMVAEALGIHVEKREISVFDLENFKPGYVKKNPLHSIPALDNNGTILVDSHAISTYLIDKYGNNSNLYPKDLEIRSQIDSKLYFDIGYAFRTMRTIFLRYFLKYQSGSLTNDQKQELNNIYNILNIFLQGKDWMVGNNVTVADISLYSTITTSSALLLVDTNKYANVSKWLKNFEKLPYANVNRPGLDIFQKKFYELMGSN